MGIYRIFHPADKEYILFSAAHGTSLTPLWATEQALTNTKEQKLFIVFAQVEVKESYKSKASGTTKNSMNTRGPINGLLNEQWGIEETERVFLKKKFL